MEIEASNKTDNPSMILLEEKGYELWLEKIEDSDRVYWCASKEGRGFTGCSGADLLGIVILWERFGSKWHKRYPKIYDELIDQIDDPYDDSGEVRKDRKK